MSEDRELAIVGVVGSLRRASLNASLLRAAAALAPANARVEIEAIRGIPVYDGDLEAESGIPEPVAELKEKIAGASALLLASPEYNGSLPGPLKNAVDWLSRPPADIARVFRDKPAGIMGASPGRGGTARAQAAWRPVLERLGARVFDGATLTAARAKDAFDHAGALASDDLRDELSDFMAAFCRFAAQA